MNKPPEAYAEEIRYRLPATVLQKASDEGFALKGVGKLLEEYILTVTKRNVSGLKKILSLDSAALTVWGHGVLVKRMVYDRDVKYRERQRKKEPDVKTLARKVKDELARTKGKVPQIQVCRKMLQRYEVEGKPQYSPEALSRYVSILTHQEDSLKPRKKA